MKEFVTVLNDNGTVSRVSMKEALRLDEALMAELEREKAYRPCHSCGTHECPPGSDWLCCASTARTLNERGAAVKAQIELDAWIARHDFDPYHKYDADGCTILDCPA